MKILITGGAGYIGSHTALELLNEGYEVVVYDNLCNSSKESLKRVEELTGKSVQFYEGDVLDAEALKAMFEAEKIDAVIHCAALKAVGESVRKPLEYYQNNITGTLTLMNVMREVGVKNIVFSSSATVYGSPEEMPITEASVRMDKIHDGTDHDRSAESGSGMECDPSSLFQSGGSAQERPYRRGSERNPQQPYAVYFTGGSRKTGKTGCIWR